MVRELYTHEMGDPPMECIYQLPTADAFKTVNAGVFYTLSRLYPGQRIARDETDGAIVYHLTGIGWQAQLFILHITEKVVTMRLLMQMPNDPIERIVWIRDLGERAGWEAVTIFQMCHGSIANLLRGAALVLGPPAPPPATNMPAVFSWQEIYHPTLHDAELAKLIGKEHQTIRNERRALGKPKRGERGRSRKN